MEQQLFSRYLMSLPDSAFYDLYRTYLGPVQTPFNKQDLVRDLLRLLQDNELQQRLFALLDQDDRYWLSIIGLAGPLPPEQLDILFGSELSPVEIHQRVLNLEDRLLIITDPEDGRLRLNPLLEADLRRRAVQIDAILPDHGREEMPTPCPTNDAALFMLMAYFRWPRDLFRQSGGLRKREHDQLGGIFPQFPEKGVLGTGLESIVSSLRTLDLLSESSPPGKFAADASVWRNFFACNPRERIAYLTAGMVADSEESIEDAAACTSGLLQLLQPGYRYCGSDLRDAARFAHAAAGRRHAPWVEDILRGLETLGVLVRRDADLLAAADCLACGRTPTGSGDSPSDEAHTVPSIVVQPSFEVTFTHTVDIPDLLPLTALLEPVRFDLYPHFEITRDRCLQSQVHEPAAFAIMEESSGVPLPQNVAMSLELWRSEGRSISLHTGTVLTADLERRHIIEHHQQLSGMIRETLAPGVFLMHGSPEEIQQACADAGLGYLPSQSRQRARPSLRRFARLPETPIRQPEPAVAALPAPTSQAKDQADNQASDQPDDPAGAGQQLDAAVLLRELNRKIDTEIPDDDQREMLRRRCRSKLLLRPEQVDPGYLPNERSEAHGLDYLGKVRLLERILQSPSDLAEITERDHSGKPVRRLLRPTKLSPSGNELYLTGLQLPGGEPIRVPVRKLSLIRKVRSGFNSRR